MSINYCTLSNSTVDSFCGNRRAVVLAQLIPLLHPSTPAARRHPGPGRFVPNPVRWEQPEIRVPTELDKIVVAATFQDLVGSDQQEQDQRLDLVYVTNIEFDTTVVSVNIKNIVVH